MKLEVGDLVQLNQQRALGKWYVPETSPLKVWEL